MNFIDLTRQPKLRRRYQRHRSATSRQRVQDSSGRPPANLATTLTLVLGLVALVAFVALADLTLLPTSAAVATSATGIQAGSLVPAPSHADATQFTPGRLLVRFRPGTSDAARTAIFQRLGGTVVDSIAQLDVDVVAIGQAPPAQAARFAAEDDVLYAEPDYRYHIVGSPPARLLAHLSEPFDRVASPLSPQAVPNDPDYALQWMHRIMHTEQAWDVGKATGIVVAVLDTGVDCTHPDLAASCLPGRDIVNGDDDASDDQGHGTIEAGVAAAVVDNAIGVAGLAWGAKILPVKVMGADGSGSMAEISNGIVWAADHGAQVINMSLGGPNSSKTLEDAVAYAVQKGIPLVAAAGNMGNEDVSYPAGLDNVIAVASTDPADSHPRFSQRGDHMDVAAPGVGIQTTTMRGGYGRFDGTSESTAVVSGLLALVRARDLSRSPAAVQKLIQDTAVDLGATGKDPYFGWGRVDAGAALASAAKPDVPTPAPTLAPSPVPTPMPTPLPSTCAGAWRIALHAFPDTVGQALDGCTGCDGQFQQGDVMAAANCPLEPLQIQITSGNDPTQVIIWQGTISRHATGALDIWHYLSTCTPPPYRVTVLTKTVACYALCPNSPQTAVLTQADFDRSSGSWAGEGRSAAVRWSFNSARCGSVGEP